MKASILSVLALCSVVALTLAQYDYSYAPYYGGATTGNENQFFILIGALLVLTLLFTRVTTNNTQVINLTKT